ncbi:AEC family transporter [Algicella marina]|uniref:AEC family transporter n=1 Tax=Algicella marina TaxID=2683284 RepID=A0A6P1T1T0_9RHOB|nr:AEC family transporter [Algicella marina]QHQ36874.1 AEC family transporter [Algicella marina]
MSLLLEVLQIVAPVFFLAAIGFAWVKAGFEYRVQFVTRLAMTLSVPCLIFVALVETEIDPKALRDTAIATLVAYSVLGAVLFGICRLARLDVRTFWAPLTFGNTGNLGLPLALFAFGSEGFGFAVVIFAIMAVLSFTIGIYAVSGGGSLMNVVKEPIVGATLLGGVFLVMDWSLPQWSMNTLDLIGQIAIPLMLITLGVAISRLQPGAVLRASVLSVVKLVLCFAIAYWAGLQFGLGPVALAVLVLQVSTPVAVTSYMLAEKYEADSTEVAGLVVVSTLLCVFAIPVILALFV